MDLGTWLTTVNWGNVAIDIAIPVAAILVPTIIAVRLSRSERRHAEADRQEERRIALEDRENARRAAIEDRQEERRAAENDRRLERRLEAGAGVIVAVAPLASMQLNQPVQQHLWEFRARLAVYRAWISADDRSGDWLALRHREGMTLWSEADRTMDAIGGPAAISVEGMLDLLRPAHEWAASTTEMFTAFLSGHAGDVDLLRDGARIMDAYPRPGDTQSPERSTAE